MPDATRSPLRAIRHHGQSVWCDSLSRELLRSGTLARLVEEGIRGVTSNPSIFQKALAQGGEYDAELEAWLAREPGCADAKWLYERLAVRDIQLAADALRPVYDGSDGADGFVSLEVSPYLAFDTAGTIAEARRLFALVDRPNTLIKVPGTPEGAPAVEALIAEGVPVNVTLLFAVDAYRAVADAYTAGLEKLVEGGGDPSRVASVASFFVSRIDGEVDARLQQEREAADPARDARLAGLRGRAAIANARLAYALFGELHETPRWRALAERGARPQRLLWASTSTKNPDYPATLYVDELIGPDTVNTIPEATLEAVRTGEAPRATLVEGWDETLADARQTLADLAECGVALKSVTDHLLQQGVVLFADAFDGLLAQVEQKRRGHLGARLASQAITAGECGDAIAATAERWRSEGRVRRLWRRDASLWTGADEAEWLGWLDAVEAGRGGQTALERAAVSLEPEGFDHVLLMGMGGSSLCPDVLARVFGAQPGSPALLVLDSTVPAQVARVGNAIDPARTLFVVPSKSGTTIEPNVLMAHFHAELAERVGEAEAGRRFAVVTDPGSALEEHAERAGFGAVVHGHPGIGGRFSALSPFGLLPARLMGLAPERLLDAAQPMVQACGASVPPAENPGVALGLALGTWAQRGRDKLTLFLSPGLESLGGWLEQLVAESTGHAGHGIVPVDGELPGPPEVYGADRVFVHVALRGEHGVEPAALDALAAAGHPVVRIDLAEREQIAAEFYRWEIATAVAGALLGVNPFVQPDVESAKVAARSLLAEYEANGALPEPPERARADGVRVYTDDGLAVADGATLEAILASHLSRLGTGDYFAINAFLDMEASVREPLQRLRHAVRDARGVATTLGFGPRFLHSTGQLHKGGPRSGMFLQLTAEADPDVPIPGQRGSFGVLAAAQARGDFEVLAERGRRILHLHLPADPRPVLHRLADAAGAALRGST